MADGSSRDIAHGLFAVSVPLRDGMDAGRHMLLLLTKALPPMLKGAEPFCVCLQGFLKKYGAECCQLRSAVDIEEYHLKRKGRNSA